MFNGLDWSALYLNPKPSDSEANISQQKFSTKANNDLVFTPQLSF